MLIKESEHKQLHTPLNISWVAPRIEALLYKAQTACTGMSKDLHRLTSFPSLVATAAARRGPEGALSSAFSGDGALGIPGPALPLCDRRGCPLYSALWGLTSSSGSRFGCHSGSGLSDGQEKSGFLQECSWEEFSSEGQADEHLCLLGIWHIKQIAMSDDGRPFQTKIASTIDRAHIKIWYEVIP